MPGVARIAGIASAVAVAAGGALASPARAPLAQSWPQRPKIVWRPIPFGAKRKRETAAYARRHYGIDSYALTAPKVIVEHYTGSTTFASAFSTFARDAPDAELHELPELCSHFVVDRDGTIYQLVSLRLMCRHTVGLNYTAIGIEHVGTSDRQILQDRRQLRASLALTRYLRCRYRIRLADVIGHSESLTSAYHRERVARLRRQTHADWSHADMALYRRMLARRPCGVAAAAAARRRTRLLGRSIRHRPITLVTAGDPRARWRVLVVGCIHGDEPAGRAVVASLERGRPPAGTQLLLVRDLNPDGVAAGTRQNARGVDLNRNGSVGWRSLGPPGSRYYSGPRPFSEPESRAIARLIARERPNVTIWYHQPWHEVDVPERGSSALARRYARAARLPLVHLGARPGSLSLWTNARMRAGSSFVVELPGGRLSRADVRRQVTAVLTVAAIKRRRVRSRDRRSHR